jgi:hypothetical protein
MHFEIVRQDSLSDGSGSFGTLSIDGQPFCDTCEQPWNNNIPDHSCIPVGDYELQPYNSPAHGPTVVFHNPALGIYGTPAQIPAGQAGRSLCEIHPANWPFQLKGCLAVGGKVMDLGKNGLGVTDSVAHFQALAAKWGNRAGLTASVRRIP